MKRVFCIILCICLVMCLVPPVTAEAAAGDFIGGADGDPLKLVYDSTNSTILLQARTDN